MFLCPWSQMSVNKFSERLGPPATVLRGGCGQFRRPDDADTAAR